MEQITTNWLSSVMKQLICSMDLKMRCTIMLYTYCEKHKVLLVVLPDTVVDPWTVVVHLPYASFTHTVNSKVKLEMTRQM